MSKIIGIIILTTVVSLILLSLFLTLTNSSPQTQKGSPENIVQTYITSIVEEKFNNSYSLLSKEIKTECGFTQYINNIEREIELFERGNVIHEKTLELEKDLKVIVYINISIVNTTVPFSTNEYIQEEKITLIKEDIINDEPKWKILETSFFNSCEIENELK